MSVCCRSRFLFVAGLLALVACRSSKGSYAELLASPPPVVKGSRALGPFGDGQDPARSATSTPSSTPSSDGPLAMRATLSHAYYSRSSPSRLVLKIDLAGSAAGASSRRPLNLALVFDRSGSMADDEKFTHAMAAARLVIENLSERDIISLIAFNERALVLSPAGRAVNKEFLYYRLGQFAPKGYTNLSAGVLEAFAQIESKKADGQLEQVIVLTDGLANRGITDPVKMRRLVEAAHKKGIGLSTLGCGSKFDEKVLASLAEAGGGRYTYVQSAEQIPNAIAAEVDGLLDVVAQNVKLDVRAGGGSKITRVYGRLIEEPTPFQSFFLGDVRTGEKSVFLLDLLPDSKSQSAAGVELTLTLDNPRTGSRERKVLTPTAAYTEDSNQVRKSANQSVLMYARVLDAMEKAEEAIQGLDTERFHEARSLFDQSYEAAHRYARDTRDQQLLNETFLLRHFMAELSAANDSALIHGHQEAQRRIQKTIDYRRYLLEHHRGGGGP